MSKKQPKEIRIESILEAAVDEFLLKGYDGASIDAIAKRAGVSKGGFYHHFSNKEVLLMETNRKLSEPVMIMAEKACANESAYAGLSIYIKEYLKYWAERPRELSFFFLSNEAGTHLLFSGEMQYICIPKHNKKFKYTIVVTQ